MFEIILTLNVFYFLLAPYLYLKNLRNFAEPYLLSQPELTKSLMKVKIIYMYFGAFLLGILFYSAIK